MKKIFTVTFVLFVIVTNLCAQEFPIINKEKLIEIIDKDSEHDYFMVTIFTNGCSGINYINNTIKFMDSLTDGRTRQILCQSSSGKDRGEVLKTVMKEKDLPESTVHVIDESTYKIVKKDAREQGMLFKNDICWECKFMAIGTPYRIILDKKMNVLYHGFFDNRNVAAIFSIK